MPLALGVLLKGGTTRVIRHRPYLLAQPLPVGVCWVRGVRRMAAGFVATARPVGAPAMITDPMVTIETTLVPTAMAPAAGPMTGRSIGI
ncbi:hypothetical protein H6CHR_03253 [Variovorax sp. PBL-H6]|uniref:hypothetical protein n=1 Tax=Variovorax sp. PBL-H6 TaxID=434009 RepID=UPI001319AE52|nr:hypothetical protein [Variovorax sp. PBL-H6]VTU29734.1 hypothetical protein H6CHR_03253 [Variovorax sp. PBL-H6]